MKDRDDLEAWADALLDQHRSAPPPPGVDDLPPMWRFMIKHGHVEPDADTIERVHRNANRQRHFANAEAIVTLIGVIALAVFLISFYSHF